MKTLVDKGLPFHKRSYEFGNLYIKFNVTFPDSLTSPQLTALNKSLLKAKIDDAKMADAEETCQLLKYSESQRNTKVTGGTKANESDEEEDDDFSQRGQRV